MWLRSAYEYTEISMVLVRGVVWKAKGVRGESSSRDS